ncbi:MAG: Crp/Fnr family transcriptional regulator, partial [Burkholderiales bacterium]|nr:Crp/Fnr family transcriptional regulator [Burkholderiales bacterium]
MDTAVRLHDVAPRRSPMVHLTPVRAGQTSTLSDLLHLMGAGADAQGPLAGTPIPLRFLHAGDTLFHEGAPAEAIYFVRAGTFKTLRTAEDGYEQVLGFVGRAEVLGFDALCRGRHPSAAVALEDSSVYVVLANDVLSLGQRLPALDRIVHLAVSAALTHRGEVADVMAAVAAEVRLARFLVQLSRRMAECGQASRRFHLRMSRRDIASHLGVA